MGGTMKIRRGRPTKNLAEFIKTEMGWKGASFEDVIRGTDGETGCQYHRGGAIKEQVAQDSFRSTCSSRIWLRNDLNLAHITSPLPLLVVVADQYKWFTHGFTHSFSISIPFCLASFETSLWISIRQKHRII